ncbi:MAG: tetratricopeptide repeat protein [Bacteroidota bacterium]
MDKNEQYELIGRYLRKELNEDELQQITTLINQDEDFASELNLHSNVHQTLGDTELNGFHQQLSNAEQIYFQSQSRAKQRRLLVYGMAATLLISISFVGIRLLVTTPADPQQLFGSYFKPYDAPVHFRSETSPYADAELKNAMELYDAGQYQEAIPYLSNAVQRYPENQLVVLLRGICFLATNQIPAAQRDFNVLAQAPQSLFADQGKWYLALSYLKENKPEEAKSLLGSLQSAALAVQARKLLSEMK